MRMDSLPRSRAHVVGASRPADARRRARRRTRAGRSTVSRHRCRWARPGRRRTSGTSARAGCCRAPRSTSSRPLWRAGVARVPSHSTWCCPTCATSAIAAAGPTTPPTWASCTVKPPAKPSSPSFPVCLWHHCQVGDLTCARRAGLHEGASLSVACLACAVVIFGAGWPGRLRRSGSSSMRCSTSGRVQRGRVCSRPTVVGRCTSTICMGLNLASTSRGVVPRASALSLALR